jgi:DUF1009 family protein
MPEAEGRPRPATSGEPLAIIAAGGNVPFEVATAAAAQGRPILIIGLDGVADERLRSFPFEALKWGQMGRLEQLLAANGTRDIVLIGAVDRRPDFTSIGLDFGTLKYLPRLIKAMAAGDDSVLGSFVKALEEKGYRVVGAHEVAPALIAGAGLVAGPSPSQSDREDAALALVAARAIGALDIGQGAVAVGGRVVALEAAEGTDAMLERVVALRDIGRVKWKGRAGALAKRSKPQQDIRVDMPAVGPHTVERVARAGLAGIAIEPGRVLIAERAETLRLATETGTFIYAVADEAASGGA